jgi:hypothetical protein
MEFIKFLKFIKFIKYDEIKKYPASSEDRVFCSLNGYYSSISFIICFKSFIVSARPIRLMYSNAL